MAPPAPSNTPVPDEDADTDEFESGGGGGGPPPAPLSDEERARLLERVRVFLADTSSRADPDPERAAEATRTMLRIWRLDEGGGAAGGGGGGDDDDASIIERAEAAVGRDSAVVPLADRISTHSEIAQLLVAVGDRVDAPSVSNMASVLQYVIVLSDMMLRARRVYSTMRGWVASSGASGSWSDLASDGELRRLDDQAKGLGFLPPPLLQPPPEGERRTKVMQQYDLLQVVVNDAMAKGYRISEDGQSVMRRVEVELEDPNHPGAAAAAATRFETPAWRAFESLRGYVVSVMNAPATPEEVKRAFYLSSGVVESMTKSLFNTAPFSPYFPILRTSRYLFAFRNAAVDISPSPPRADRRRTVTGPLAPPRKTDPRSPRVVFRKFATAEKGAAVARWLAAADRACTVAIFVASSDAEEARRDWERLERKNAAGRLRALAAGAQLHGAAARPEAAARMLADWAAAAGVRWSSPAHGSALFVLGASPPSGGCVAAVAAFRRELTDPDEEEEGAVFAAAAPDAPDGSSSGAGDVPETRVDPVLDAFLLDATARAAHTGTRWRPRVWVYGRDNVPADVAACNFFDVHLDVDGLRPFLDDAVGLCWTDIRTPNVERVMASQNWAPDVRRWAYAMLGRMLFAQNEVDKWQVALFMAGMPGTGKGTLVSLMADFFSPDKRGLISAVAEQTFGLESLKDKYILYGPEIGDGGSIQEQLFFSMVAGEAVKVNQKHKTASDEHGSLGHIMVAVNRFPPKQWSHTSEAFARRCVAFLFPNMVRIDTGLPDAMRGDDMGAGLLIKLACAFMWAVHEVGEQAVLLHMPDSIRLATRAALKVSDTLQRFLASGRVELWIATDGYREWLDARHHHDASTARDEHDGEYAAVPGKRAAPDGAGGEASAGPSKKKKKGAGRKEKGRAAYEPFAGDAAEYDPPPEFVVTKMDFQEAFARFCRQIGADSSVLSGMFAEMNMASSYSILSHVVGGVDHYKGVRIVEEAGP